MEKKRIRPPTPRRNRSQSGNSPLKLASDDRMKPIRASSHGDCMRFPPCVENSVRKTKSLTPRRMIVSQDDNPYFKLFSQFCLLKQLFPDFPTSMLSILLLREDGQAKIVAKGLMKRGWKTENKALIEKLTEQSSDLLTCGYYWGELTDSYLDQLIKNPIGSFFTALDERNNFIVCYVDDEGGIIEECESPILVEAQKQLYQLKNPLQRPGNLPLIRLAPALEG